MRAGPERVAATEVEYRTTDAAQTYARLLTVHCPRRLRTQRPAPLAPCFAHAPLTRFTYALHAHARNWRGSGVIARRDGCKLSAARARICLSRYVVMPVRAAAFCRALITRVWLVHRALVTRTQTARVRYRLRAGGMLRAAVCLLQRARWFLVARFMPCLSLRW